MTLEQRFATMMGQIEDLAKAGNPTAVRIISLAWMLQEEPGPSQEAIGQAIRAEIHLLNRELNNEWRLKEPA